MSVIMIAKIICDVCGIEDDYSGLDDAVPNRSNARSYYKQNGWKTGLKATARLPSAYDIKTDVCESCQPW